MVMGMGVGKLFGSGYKVFCVGGVGSYSCVLLFMIEFLVKLREMVIKL